MFLEVRSGEKKGVEGRREGGGIRRSDKVTA